MTDRPFPTKGRVTLAQMHFASNVRLLCKVLDAAGIRYVLGPTRRSHRQQAALYAKGRSAPGAIVTQCPPGYSAHQYSLGRDCILISDHGEPLPGDHPSYAFMAKHARQLNITSGYYWKHFHDPAHLEHYCWRSYVRFPSARR